MIAISGRGVTLFELVVGCLLIVFSSINVGIYVRLKKRFSIKYELLRDPNFRGRKWLQSFVQVLYRIELVIPILLMVALFLSVAIREVKSGFVVLANGFLLLSLIYLTNASTFYIKVGIILFLVVIAQLLTLYLSQDSPEDILYTASSSIFFSLNGILVSLTVFAKEGVYWDLSEAFKMLKEEVKKVNDHWLKSTPKIVDGGIYGWFNKRKLPPSEVYEENHERSERSQDVPPDNEGCCDRKCRNNHSLWPIIFYLLSLVVLVIYAFQDWWFERKFIGTISAGAILTFDFAIFVLSSLSQETRSPFSVMVVIFVIRFFLFVFGNTYWFMGYCLLYILIGTFIAYLIIEKRFPKLKVEQIQQTLNALKTPEFIFILITTELVIMIIALYVSNNKDLRAETFIINGREFQFWSVGVISIIITFIFSLYLASMRVLYRSLNKIRDKVVYYFFDQAITEYHVFLLVTYALIVVLGVYTYFKYQSSMSLMLCLFLPLIYVVFVQMGVCWQQNNYYILADIDQYNKKQRRKRKIEMNKRDIMSKMIDNKELIDKLGREQKKTLKRAVTLYKNTLVDDHDSSAHDMVQENHITEESQDPHEMIDWRDEKNNIGFPQLFLYITGNDKKFLLFVGIFLILNAAMIITSYLWCSSNVGLYISISLFSYIFQVSYYRCTKTIHNLQVFEIIGIIAGFLMGLILWSVFWYQFGGGLTWSIIFICILSYLLVEAIRTNQDQRLLYITIITQILLLMVYDVLIIYFNFRNAYYVIIACGVMFYFILGLVLYYLFVSFNKALPRWVYYTFASVVGVTLLAVIIAAPLISATSIMATFSIAALVPLGGGVLFGWVQFYYRYLYRFDNVIVYSAYGLPAHRFVSQKEAFKKDEFYLYVYFIALMGLVVYAEIVFFFFENNVNAGIYSLCFFEVVGFMSLMLIVMRNYHEIGKDKSEITVQILRDTFQLLIQKYMPDIDNDENTGKMMDELEELEKEVEANPEAPNINEKYDQIVYRHDTIVHNEEEEEVFLFFWIGLIEFRILSKKKEVMNNLLNSVKEVKEELENVGIAFSYEDDIDLEIRYEKLLNQIRILDPMKQLIFEKIMREHREKVEVDKKEADKIDEIERNKNEQRELELEMKIFAQSSVIKEGYTMSDIDKQKIEQFKKLVKSLEAQKILYEDTEFPADQSSLGTKVVNKVHGWQRPSAKCEVIKGKIDVKDIKQGQVGDCYLISTLGVLGEEKIRKALGLPFVNRKGEQVASKWPCDGERGVFMVRFKKFKQNIFIVIDNQLPVDATGNWVCGRSEDPEEIWVNIMEKAYAKMYGSYSKIFGGKAHFVMAEFTGGFPSEILLEQYTHNVNALWRKLQSYYENHYIMAAGSPPGSDSTYSKLGIAKGHAYAILQVKTVESFRLIQLKNPQGSKSLEWKGDFGDKSAQMDNRMRGLLGHNDEADGIFWMPIVDFVREFKSLYICREFDENWKKTTFIGAWQKQKNSFGNQKNKNIQKNPQYGITVTQKCTLFISLTQQRDELQITSVGANKMAFRLQKNNGKRIYFKDISSQSLCTPAVTPTTNVTLSNEYQLQEATYPWTYTLMVYTQDKGDEGSYLIEIYCNDKNVTIVDDKDFDLPQN